MRNQILFTDQLYIPNPDIVVIVVSMKCGVSEPVRILSIYLSRLSTLVKTQVRLSPLANAINNGALRSTEDITLLASIPAMPDWEQCEGNDEVLSVIHHNGYVLTKLPSESFIPDTHTHK